MIGYTLGVDNHKHKALKTPKTVHNHKKHSIFKHHTSETNTGVPAKIKSSAHEASEQTWIQGLC